MAALNMQEERFVQGLFEGLSQRQAYLAAFPQATKWKPETVDSKACVLAKDEKVRARLEEIKAENAANAQMSRQTVLKMLENIASTKGVKFKGSDIINALKLIVDMCGYDAPQEITVSADTTATITDILTLLKGGDAE